MKLKLSDGELVEKNIDIKNLPPLWGGTTNMKVVRATQRIKFF